MRCGIRLLVSACAVVGAALSMLCLPHAGLAEVSAKTDSELSSKDIGSKETLVGDLVADAIRSAAKSDVAFVPASSFSETPINIAKGPFSSNDLLKSLEYKGDTVTVVKLTGDQITRAVEHGLYLYPKFNSGFLQLSGLIVTVNPDAEAEKRVVSVKVGGETLSASKTYKVAMPAPLAKGALAYFKIWKKSDIDHDTDETLENAVNNYLNEHKSLAKGDERFVVKEK